MPTLQCGQNGDERPQWVLAKVSLLLPEQAWKGRERCPNVLEGKRRSLALAQGSLSPGKEGKMTQGCPL